MHPGSRRAGSTFPFRQGFQFLNGRRFVEIVAEHGNIDVLGKPLDQAVSLRQGRATLEEEARSSGGSLTIECIQGPADPEVLLDIVDRGAEPVGGREKQIEPVACRRGDDFPVGCGSHCGALPVTVTGRSVPVFGRADKIRAF